MIEYTIYCDACGEMIDIQTGSARQARRKAKAKKLLVRVARKDYCQSCAAKLPDELLNPPKPERKPRVI